MDEGGKLWPPSIPSGHAFSFKMGKNLKKPFKIDLASQVKMSLNWVPETGPGKVKMVNMVLSHHSPSVEWF